VVQIDRSNRSTHPLTRAIMLCYPVPLHQSKEVVPVHHPVRRPCLVVLAALFLAGSAGSLEARVLAPQSSTDVLEPAWIDGTHIVAEAYRDTISRLASLPPRPRVRTTSPSGVGIGQGEIFWAIDMVSRQPYTLKAYLRKVGKHCYLYAEDGYDLPDEVAQRLADQFDQVIYPTDRSWFGSEASPGIDGDRRITLLLLDIQDGWAPGKGYVAGYYFPLDGISADLFPQSNEREMFYLDTKPGEPGRSNYLGVLAHEFQHMIHFNNDRRETRWLNEALAQLAFYVCGYGHAPQVFQYIRNTDVNMEDFQNTLENYGAAYLWMYYLHGHYAGTTDDQRRDFFRGLVASPKGGFDSIRDALARAGVTRRLEEIYTDWAVANAAGDPAIDGGRYGYDASLSFGVNNAAQTYGMEGLASDDVEQTVNPWAADYIVYANDLSWSPRRPSMADKVTVSGAKPGQVVWNVNDRELPPPKIVPEGSSINEGEREVTTALVRDESGRYSVAIGPFSRLGVEIRSLNFRFRFDDGTESLPRSVAIFTLPSLVSASSVRSTPETDAAGKLVFTFAGERKKATALRAVLKLANGTTRVVEIPLDGRNRATWTLAGGGEDLESLTFVVVGLHAKKTAKYSYRLARVPARDQLRRTNFSRIEQRGGAAGAAGLHGRVGLAGAALLAPVAGRVPARAARALRSDDEDTSHDNLGYFLNKKQELIHNLTHLMIDPFFLEGQLFKLWKLLELVRGFPHLPLPDGLAIVDYDEKRAQDLVAGWASEFGIEVQGLPGGPVAPRTGEDQERVKEVAKRLYLSERIVEFSYNNGLLMAQDFSMTVYYFIRFIFGSKSTLDTIARSFSGIPVIGSLAVKLKKIIVGKLIRAGDNLVWMLSAKMRAPYNLIIPLAYSILANTISRSLEIPLDPREAQGFNKEYIVGTFGKYALTSIPKIGYVARTQKAVDLASELAGSLVAGGTWQDAVRAVWDDGNPNTDESLRERIAVELTRRHNQAFRDQQIAWITGKLAEVANLISIIDPTSISRVVSIVLHVGTAGIFAHAGWVTLSYFYRLANHESITGVQTAYDPGFAAPAQLAEAYAPNRPNRTSIDRVARDLEEAFAEYVAEAEALVTDSRNERSFDRIFALDGRLDDLTGRAQGILFGTERGKWAEEPRTAADDDLDTLYTESQRCLMERAGLLSDLFARRASGPTATVPLGSRYVPSFDRYLAVVRGGLARLASRDEAGAALFVAESRVARRGDGFQIEAVVANESGQAVTDVAVRLVSGLAFDASDGAERTVARLGAGREVRLSWRIRLTEARPLPMPQVTITVEAPGAKGLSRTLLLED
jgi:hypothetical protein